MMDAAGGPDAFLEDHAVIVCSDHSQSPVEDEIDLFRAFDGFGVLPAGRAPRRGRRDRGLPELARRAGLRARPRPPARPRPADRAHAARARGRRPRGAADGPPRRRGDRPRRARRRRRRAALRAARRPADRARRRWSVEGDLDAARPRGRGRPRALGDVPGRARARVWAALRCRTAGDVLASAAARLRVPRLGRRAPRRRRLARLAARQRLARRADLVRHRARRPTAASSGRCATSSRWSSSTSA